MKYIACLLHNLSTVFYNSTNVKDNLTYAKCFKNEGFCTQIAFLGSKEEKTNPEITELVFRVQSPLKKHIKLYKVEHIPATRIGYSHNDDWFLRTTPGLYPDCLAELEQNNAIAVSDVWETFFVSVNETNEMLQAGEYPVRICILDKKTNKVLVQKQFRLTIMDHQLPENPLWVTNWLHYDCISHFSHTKPFSKAFYKVLEKYVRLAVQSGQNTILTPCFTPPLDTEIGKERKTVQLVGVQKTGENYQFDFSKLKYFIEFCLHLGIRNFEHNHMFTQWGAYHTPKIEVTENGKRTKMFGWHTDAASEAYYAFLHSYFCALKAFLTENGWNNRFFFHASDEPADRHAESYKKASDFMQKELKGYPMGDALADVLYYENGMVQTPIAATHTIEDFIGKADPLFLYYTGGHVRELFSNRVFGMEHARNRVLGAQLYYHNIKGFLHWGFNAHHDMLCRHMVDPKQSSDMNGWFTGGTSYLVYPNGANPQPSLRLFVFKEQMQDIRAFYLLESLTTRETVQRIIKKHIPDISFRNRVTADRLLALREEINNKIMNI